MILGHRYQASQSTGELQLRGQEVRHAEELEIRRRGLEEAVVHVYE